MKEYENRSTASNPFNISFGTRPYEYIGRESDKKAMIEQIASPLPPSFCYFLTGVRGSGKTVMLTSVSRHFEKSNDWIVIDLNPEDDIREGLAAKLYTAGRLKHLFLEKDFSFSFYRVSFRLTGKNPILNIDDLLSKMMEEVKRQGKKVLITIDEASNNLFMRQFALSFQMLIRKEYPLFLLVTSPYENISSLENEKNMTFLIRSPKLYLSSLSIQAMTLSYQSVLSLTYEDAFYCAKLTKGYAFAFQLLGYLMYGQNKAKPDSKILSRFDGFLEEYAYDKIWFSLTEKERAILESFKSNSPVEVSLILSKCNMSKEYLSRYRDRLIKKGILVSPTRGKLMFALPRFKEFIEAKTAFE